jgi:hypothetical protein
MCCSGPLRQRAPKEGDRRGRKAQAVAFDLTKNIHVLPKVVRLLPGLFMGLFKHELSTMAPFQAERDARSKHTASASSPLQLKVLDARLCKGAYSACIKVSILRASSLKLHDDSTNRSERRPLVASDCVNSDGNLET